MQKQTTFQKYAEDVSNFTIVKYVVTISKA